VTPGTAKAYDTDITENVSKALHPPFPTVPNRKDRPLSDRD